MKASLFLIALAAVACLAAVVDAAPCNAVCPGCGFGNPMNCKYGCGGNSYSQCQAFYAGGHGWTAQDLDNCYANGAALGTPAVDGGNDCSYGSPYTDGSCSCSAPDNDSDWIDDCCAFDCAKCASKNTPTSCLIYDPALCAAHDFMAAASPWTATDSNTKCVSRAKTMDECAEELSVADADRDCWELACLGEGVGCSKTKKALDTVCDDGNKCTKDTKCNADGLCVGVTVTCSDILCRQNVACDPNHADSTGCPVVSAGTDCDDPATPCKLGDTCNASGVCVDGATDRICPEDTNPCSVAACKNDTPDGCYQANNAEMTCSDNDDCTVDDKCVDTVCTGTLKCPDECQTCNPGTFECESATGASCASSAGLGTLLPFAGVGLGALCLLGAAGFMLLRRPAAVDATSVGEDAPLKKAAYTSGMSNFTRGPGTTNGAAMAGAAGAAGNRMTQASLMTRGSSSPSRKSTGSKGRNTLAGGKDDLVSVATTATRGSSKSRDTVGTVKSNATRSSAGSRGSRGRDGGAAASSDRRSNGSRGRDGGAAASSDRRSNGSRGRDGGR